MLFALNLQTSKQKHRPPAGSYNNDDDRIALWKTREVNLLG
jgi:hypothetical protein